MENRERIPKTVQWLMVGTAAFVDFAQFIVALSLPVLGSIVDRITMPLVWFGYYIWFKFYGVSFVSPKKLFAMLGGTSLELLLSELPTWTFTILYMTKGEKVLGKAFSTIPGGEIVGESIKKSL